MSKEKSMTGSQVPNVRGKITISKENLKRRIATFTLVGAILGGTLTGIGIAGIDKIEESLDVREATEPYSTVITDNTYRTADNRGYFYRNNEIALDLQEQFGNDIKMDIYGTYKSMNANAVSNMNEVVKELLGITFEDYLIQEGFSDSEGNIDLDAYDEFMGEYIQLHQDLQELEGGPKLS